MKSCTLPGGSKILLGEIRSVYKITIVLFPYKQATSGQGYKY